MYSLGDTYTMEYDLLMSTWCLAAVNSVYFFGGYEGPGVPICWLLFLINEYQLIQNFNVLQFY